MNLVVLEITVTNHRPRAGSVVLQNLNWLALELDQEDGSNHFVNINLESSSPPISYETCMFEVDWITQRVHIYPRIIIEPAQMSENDDRRAGQACLSCKKMKRGCDKALPECSLCVRTKKSCTYEYSDVAPIPTSKEFQWLQQKVLELEARMRPEVSDTNSSGASFNTSPPSSSLTSSIRSPDYSATSERGERLSHGFPPMFFLDTLYFKMGGFSIEKPLLCVPQEIMIVLGATTELMSMIEQYFATIHTWIPIGRIYSASAECA